MVYLSAALVLLVLAASAAVFFLVLRKRSVVASDASIAEMFSSAAERLMSLDRSANIYGAIAEELHKVSGDSFVLVNSFDNMYDQFSSSAISGVGPLVQKALQMLGRDYLNTVFKLDGEARQILTSGRLKKVEGGIHRISLGKVPMEIAEDIDQFFKVRHFYAMGLTREGKLLGNVIIIPIFGNDLKDLRTVEAAVKLASAALSRVEKGDSKGHEEPAC